MSRGQSAETRMRVALSASRPRPGLLLPGQLGMVTAHAANGASVDGGG